MKYRSFLSRKIRKCAGAQHFLQDCMWAQRRLRSAWHLCRLIIVFAVGLNMLWILGYPKKILAMIKLHECTGWSESSLGARAILWEMLCPGSNNLRLTTMAPAFIGRKLLHRNFRPWIHSKYEMRNKKKTNKKTPSEVSKFFHLNGKRRLMKIESKIIVFDKNMYFDVHLTKID